MKICIAHKLVQGPWGGGNSFAEQLGLFLKRKNYDVVFELSPNIDVVLMIDPRAVSAFPFDKVMEYKNRYPNVKIIHRVNDTDKARPYAPPTREKYFIDINKQTDHTIFISEWLRDHYVEGGFDLDHNHSVIVNGCSSEYYYPKEENKIGSTINLITHHWGDGPLKGFDIYNYLDIALKDQPVNFTYLGRYNKDYQPKNINLIPPQSPKEIGNILREHDLYITGARWEACGMHHIEAARCGLPVLYHKEGGAVPEVCRNHGVEYYDELSLFRGLQEIIDNYDSYRSKIDYDYLSIDRCCEEYEKVILNVL
jgi:glycosyltransferase involved in cell wall biosynthesis